MNINNEGKETKRSYLGMKVILIHNNILLNDIITQWKRHAVYMEKRASKHSHPQFCGCGCVCMCWLECTCVCVCVYVYLLKQKLNLIQCFNHSKSGCFIWRENKHL